MIESLSQAKDKKAFYKILPTNCLDNEINQAEIIFVQQKNKNKVKI
jgi:hypothetical protein